MNITQEMWDALCARVTELEKGNARLVKLGPREPNALELGAAARQVDKIVEAMKKDPPPPVDESSRVLVSGAPVPEDGSHREINPSIGQQKDYVVLSAEERSRGFVRPFRDAYRHQKCGKITTMGRAIAETYARKPDFYSGTFCTTCRDHFPVGEAGEFTWYEMDGTDGPKVGT